MDVMDDTFSETRPCLIQQQSIKILTRTESLPFVRQGEGI